MREAGAVGVPFVTAYEGLRRAGCQARQMVLVCGANGAGGQAAMQIAAISRQVIGVVRSGRGRLRAATAAHCRCQPGGRCRARARASPMGAAPTLVYNTVGSPYFEAPTGPWRSRGRCSSRPSSAPCRSTSSRSTAASTPTSASTRWRSTAPRALILDRLAAVRQQRAAPFPVAGDAVFGLDRALPAYREVLDGRGGAFVIEPREVFQRRSLAHDIESLGDRRRS
jgi:NADPH2:quinone reductase